MAAAFLRRRRTWVLAPPRVESCRAGSRVVMHGPHGRITFACSSHLLFPSMEAFVGLLLLPAWRRGLSLATEVPLDAGWLEGMRRMVGRWRSWWGGGDFPLEAPVRDGTSAPPAPGSGLCFTAGVDSFYTLLRAPDRATHLVFVHGYDVPLGDRRRMAALRPSLEAVARALGKQLVVLESDLRENHFFAAVSWERTHGAALAAAGHLLVEHLGLLTFGPSWIWGDLRPWGTHPETDAWWSSSRLRMEPGPATANRDVRVREIAGHPLVHQHLHVCWENRSTTGNCGRCEKCVRTMVVLAGLGVLDRCVTFDSAIDLPGAVDALPAFPPGYDLVWGDMLALELDPPLRAAVERLVARSRGRPDSGVRPAPDGDPAGPPDVGSLP